MPSYIPHRYPVDLTGVNPSNLVPNEPVVLTSQGVRVVSPMYAPYFKDSLVIVDAVTSQQLISTQFKVLNLVTVPTAQLVPGKEVYDNIIITDRTVNNNLLITYQSIGGDYTRSFDTAKILLDSLFSDSRPVTWPNVTNKPEVFSPTLHTHAVGDIFSWEFVCLALERLRAVLVLSDSISDYEVLSYLDSRIAVIQAQAVTTINTPVASAVAASNTAAGVAANALALAQYCNTNVSAAQAAASALLAAYVAGIP
jgi:hypothetical protein